MSGVWVGGVEVHAARLTKIKQRQKGTIERIGNPHARKDLATCHSRQLLCVSLARGHEASPFDQAYVIARKSVVTLGLWQGQYTILPNVLANSGGASVAY